MVPSVLAKLRSTLVFGLLDRAKSASVTLQYKLCGKEHWGPTFAAIMAPIMFVSRLAFVGAEAQEELQMAWRWYDWAET